MSPFHNSRSPPYKKYQCRYFDEKGQPLNTPCNQADRCRFVHPTDPNWPGLKYRPFPARPGSNSTSQKTAGQVGSARATRSGALVSQTDLFRLECKVEAEDDMTSLQGPRQRNDHERDGYRPYANRQDIVPKQNRNTDKFDTTVKFKSKSEGRPSSGGQNDFNTKAVSCDSERSDSRDAVRPPVRSRNSVLREKDYATGCATKMADIVRSIANLSNQAVQDSAKHAASERNLNNFNEMSTTLSKISSSAAAAVATPLADTIMDHLHNQERMEANFTALEGEWQHFFETFTAEITGIVERSVDDTVINLQREVDDIVQSFRESSSRKRKQSGDSLLSDEDQGRHRSGGGDDSSRSRRNHSRSRESKRHRTSLRNYSPSPTRRRENDMLPKVFKASFDDILNGIKGKLDQQVNTLQSLQKENDELKQQLHAEQRPAYRSSDHDWTQYKNLKFGAERDRK